MLVVRYLIFFALCGVANAHVSEQGLVLLLPTDVYITAGVLVVVLTLALVFVLSSSAFDWLFRSAPLTRERFYGKNTHQQALVSVLSLCVLIALLYIGFTGTRDPLENLLPLFIWTLWWICLPILQGIVGNWWRWVNPWSGVYALLRNAGLKPPLQLPSAVGQWPGILVFLLFTSFALADIAPDVPARLSLFVAGYWCFTMLCVVLFGEQWFTRGECFSMLLYRYSQLSFFGVERHAVRIGVPGWQLIENKASSISAAIFILVLLGCGSFDGLNETFAWLAMIGVNPLEFPGRSAVITETVVGLLVTNLLLIAVYGICIYAGLQIANRGLRCAEQVTFANAFAALAIAVLPIAFVYHFAHFLTTFLINGQYAIAALSDPLANGSDLLDLGSFYVTTGFMNTPASVKAIWLTQAGAVVIGHVLSVLLAHAVAVELFGNARRAIFSQAPLAVFMVVYTFIGLWLLAAPKGA